MWSARAILAHREYSSASLQTFCWTARRTWIPKMRTQFCSLDLLDCRIITRGQLWEKKLSEWMNEWMNNFIYWECTLQLLETFWRSAEIGNPSQRIEKIYVSSHEEKMIERCFNTIEKKFCISKQPCNVLY